MVLTETSSPPPAHHPSDDAFRVMVVDDSAVIRGLLTRALEGDPEIRVIASVSNGQMALSSLERQPVDVIVLDIEMPVMDGLTALPKLIKVDPAVKVIMASTLTLKNADISMRALQAGAADYIPKPTSTREIHAAESFQRELIAKVKTWGAIARQTRSRSGARALSPLAAPHAPTGASASVGSNGPTPPRVRINPGPVVLRAVQPVAPQIVAIGSSTGGPQALFQVLAALSPGLPQPIVITQHMPPTFTTILAEHITRQCKIPCCEAKEGDILKGGQVYVAPGDFHMTFVQRPGGVAVALNKEPPENFCRPAVDPMLRSLVKIYGKNILATILTGMGQDGTRGCEAVVAAGGNVIAQDEATSVVWGMPGAVATTGLCCMIAPITEIGLNIRKLALRTAP